MNNFGPASSATAFAVILAITLTGCSASQSSPQATPEPSETQTQTPSPTPSDSIQPSKPSQPDDSSSSQPQGFDAFDFTGSTLNGSAFDVEALRGQPTVFWFWTPWCTVCRSDAPGLASLEAKLGEQINFIGVAAQGSASEMVAFTAETGVTGFPHLADLDSSIWAHFGVPYQPAYVFVAASGEATLSVGSRSVSELEAELLELIG
jgi:thiol-disulfide isomerase/thioredoxin